MATRIMTKVKLPIVDVEGNSKADSALYPIVSPRHQRCFHFSRPVSERKEKILIETHADSTHTTE
jgi:hypothetical protein